jgi:hypothetical protein
MDTAAVLDLARKKTRAQFIAALPNPFLVISTEGAAHTPMQFRTIVATQGDAAVATAANAPSMEVMEVCKAPGNPYPDRISIGRARNCDIVLRDASVSKLHGHFRVVPGKLELIDSGSHNGTRVNGLPIAPDTPTPVLPGDTIVVGRVSAKLLDAGGVYDMIRLLGSLATAQPRPKP